MGESGAGAVEDEMREAIRCLAASVQEPRAEVDVPARAERHVDGPVRVAHHDCRHAEELRQVAGGLEKLRVAFDVAQLRQSVISPRSEAQERSGDAYPGREPVTGPEGRQRGEEGCGQDDGPSRKKSRATRCGRVPAGRFQRRLHSLANWLGV